MKALVLYTRHFDFTGRDGRQVTGSEVYFLPEGAHVPQEEQERGLCPQKVATDPEAAQTFLKHDLPALFELDVATQASRGRTKAAELVVLRAKHAGAFPVDAFFRSPKATPPS